MAGKKEVYRIDSCALVDDKIRLIINESTINISCDKLNYEHIHVGLHISRKEYDALIASDFKGAFFSYATRILRSRAYTIHEIRGKIRAKTLLISEGAIDDIVEQLIKELLIDDKRYFELYVNELKEKGCSSIKIRSLLSAKGLLNLAANAEEDDEKQKQYIDLTAKRFLSRNRSKDVVQQKKKLVNKLLRDGFPYYLVIEYVSDIEIVSHKDCLDGAIEIIRKIERTVPEGTDRQIILCKSKEKLYKMGYDSGVIRKAIEEIYYAN